MIMRHLVIGAAHTAGVYDGIYLERGEIAIGISAIRLETGISVKTIRSALTLLEKRHETGIVRAGLGAGYPTVYVIVNYEVWDGLSEKGHSTGHESGTVGAQYDEKGHSKGHSSFIGENVESGTVRGTVLKEVKEVKEVLPSSQPCPTAFKEFSNGENSPSDSKNQKDLERLKKSSHWPYLVDLTAWFYGPDCPNTPMWNDLTESEQVGAMIAAEKILRLDMHDEPGSEERLKAILQWATGDSFWTINTQALPPLHPKKDGIRKWQNIEIRMKKSQEGGSPDGQTRTHQSSPVPLHETFQKILEADADEQSGQNADPKQSGFDAGILPNQDELPLLDPSDGQRQKRME